jgi:two-component system response regulator RegX3
VTRVLLVEDEESISDALSYLLHKQGFQVAICPTGPDALEIFDRDGADLVLLDLMLPGPSGTEVCRSLRQRSDVPVIMLTAKDTEADKAVGLGLGADDYVTKPFSWRELAARIRAMLRRQDETTELSAAMLDAAREPLLREAEETPMQRPGLVFSPAKPSGGVDRARG